METIFSGYTPIFENDSNENLEFEDILESIEYSDSFEPVEEVYIGKTPELLAIEKELDKILAKHRKSHSSNVNLTSELKTIEKLFVKQFGFRSFTLTISYNTVLMTGGIPNAMPNAFTMAQTVLTHELESGSFKINHKKGFYDTNHALDASVFLLRGIFDYEWITGAHILAIILHEIGHEFDNTFWATLRTVAACDFNPVSFFILDFLYRPLLSKGIPFIVQMIDSIPVIRKINALVAPIMSIFGQINSLIGKNKLVKKFFSGEYEMSIDPIKFVSVPIKAIAGGFGEQRADDVATMYGYGPESQEFHWKFDTYETSIGGNATKLGPVGLVYDIYSSCLNTAMLFILPLNSHLLDEHPSDQARIKNTIKKLKKDLKQSELDPKLKKKLESDLARCEKNYEAFLSLNSDEDKWLLFTKIKRNTIDKITGGESYQTIFYRNI